MQLAGPVDVVEDPIDEQARGDLVLQGQQLAQVAILAVELIEDQLGLSGQGQKFSLVIPPNLLRAQLDLMDNSSRIPPINQQGLFRIGNPQEKSLEDALRGDWHLHRLSLLEVAVDRDDLIIEHCEVGVVAPDEVGPRSRDDRLEGGRLDDRELLAVAEAEVVAIGRVSQVGGVDLRRAQFLRIQADPLPIGQ